MRTPFVPSLAATAIASTVVALVLQSWTLVLVSLVPISLLGLGLAAPPPKPRVVVVRKLERDRASAGQDVAVEVSIRNVGPGLPMAEIEDLLPPEFRVTQGAHRAIVSLPRGATVVLSYAITARVKGAFDVGPLRIRSHDPLGLSFESTSSGESARLVVAPPMEDVRGVRIAPQRTRLSFGQVLSRTVGLGTEFFGVREYTPGDETRRVNWKASARLDRLFTNEYEGERTSDAVIVLDARTASEVGPAEGSTTELGVRAALGIASALLGSGNRVGIVIQRGMLDWVYPGYGKKQLYRILDALVRVRPGGSWGLEHVAWVLARFFPRNLLIILVSPLMDSRSVGAVAALVARGLDVAVVSPSAVEIEWRMYGRAEEYRDAYRALRLERANAIAALRRDAVVVDWDPEVPLAVALKGVERFSRRR